MKILIKTKDGDYINYDHITHIRKVRKDSNYVVKAYLVDVGTIRIHSQKSITIFEGSYEQAESWLKWFEKQIQSLIKPVNVIETPESIKEMDRKVLDIEELKKMLEE